MKNKNPFDLSSDMLRNLGEELNKLLTSSQAGVIFMFMIMTMIICIFMLVSLIRAKQLIDTDFDFLDWFLWSVCLIALLLWNF